MKREVSFYSEGQKIVGDLYLPNNSEGKKFPAVILCHGFAGVKEVALPPYAEFFAEQGFVSLVFDYRGFGGSEGERGYLVPQRQVTDIRSAITYIQSLEEFNTEKVSLWGSSFGGANAIYTASIDKRVKSLVVQLAFGSGERMIKGKMNDEEKSKIDSTLAKAWAREVTSNKKLSLKADQILTDDDSKTFYAKMSEEYPQMQVKIPITTLSYILELKPEDVVSKVKQPILIIAAENDIVCPATESEILFSKANEPKELCILKKAKHFDTYSGENFKISSQRAVEWFKRPN